MLFISGQDGGITGLPIRRTSLRRLACGEEGLGGAAVRFDLVLQLLDRSELALLAQPGQQPNSQRPAVQLALKPNR